MESKSWETPVGVVHVVARFANGHLVSAGELCWAPQRVFLKVNSGVVKVGHTVRGLGHVIAGVGVVGFVSVRAGRFFLNRCRRCCRNSSICRALFVSAVSVSVSGADIIIVELLGVAGLRL